MKKPAQEDWKAIAEEFERRWNFPHYLGAVDGKHILVQAPKKSGSLFYNYKGTFSTILLAVADANYCFIYVDVGEYGSCNDGSVLTKSALGRGLQDSSLNFPPSPNDGLNYVLVGDEAFPLKTCLMRPYPGRNMADANRHTRQVFNYRLSRGRRVVENAFGILVVKWRIFRQPIIADVGTVDVIVKAATVLHNFLRRRDGVSNELHYINPGDVDVEDGGHLRRGAWRAQHEAAGAFGHAGQFGTNNASRDAMELRDQFASYFVSAEGAVPWQDRVVRRGELSEHT
ncbi:protein ALP1-like [Amphibalanus amphitrite]|uniref:protein ALP1-like n=1 Tax=Amphibalanus amphitrite TaxID=1232801 RepID=UPI001C92194A|nr:protein ALP1-like [Amphibalanus amphitrite]